MSNSSPLHWLQNARFLCSPLFPEVFSNSCPLSWWHYLNISSSSTHFSSYPQSFPVPGTFPMSWLFTSDGQGIGASASASVLPMNIQGWFPLGLSGLISLKSKGLSRVFSNTTMWEHQFFGIQSSSYSNSHIHTWLLEKKKKKHGFNYTDLCQKNDISAYNGRNIIWRWRYRTSNTYGSL